MKDRKRVVNYHSRLAFFKHYAIGERQQWIFAIFLLALTVILWRAVHLQFVQQDFLRYQGDARHLRTATLTAHRGMLQDRHGEPLAISTPVSSVWLNPRQFIQARARWGELAELLGMSAQQLEALLKGRLQRQFIYLKRHIAPSIAEEIKTLKLSGVYLQREYRRYYPMGEVFAHALGFTDIDDKGIEGLELALNAYLTGVAGEKQVIQDKYGRIIADVRSVKMPQAGQDISLSFDQRLQYVAYRELKTAVLQHKAKAGAAVILDVQTGEVLAMVNQPAYNPNNRQQRDGGYYRNRVITDVFEPGSTLKPFTIAAALESGQYTANTLIDTNPGKLKLGQYTIHDSRNYGIINTKTIIQKSSNVGISKIALSLPKQQLSQFLQHSGLGEVTGSAFPGEVSGYIPDPATWQPTEQATLGFGYGMNVTLLQLTRAYAMFANEGVLPPIRFTPFDPSEEVNVKLPTPVMSHHTAQQLVEMLEAAVNTGGTGEKAQIAGFRVAGKTGTVRKTKQGKYTQDKYLALFAGFVPASRPRLAMAIMIDEPQGKRYYGGDVAAPVFSRVMSESLRLMNISPDKLTHQ